MGSEVCIDGPAPVRRMLEGSAPVRGGVSPASRPAAERKRPGEPSRTAVSSDDLGNHGSYNCEPDPGLIFPGGIRPPQIYAYPSACPPVRLLFVGSNPPRPFGGFWVTETGDTLRADLHRILRSLKVVETPEPDAAFVDEFRSKGRLGCSTRALEPPSGRNSW